ncbi:MAG: TIR domain-containing protein [Promethearchaeota archaeon]
MSEKYVKVGNDKIGMDENFSLNLSEKGIKDISHIKVIDKEIAEALKILNLSKNEELRKLSKSLLNFKNLEELNLEGCITLKELPNTLSELVNLRVLNLKGCVSIRSLPKTIGALINLEVLNCEAEPPIPEDAPLMVLGQLKEKMKKLGLADAKGLEMVTDEIGELKNLRELNLKKCSKLKALPKSMGNLSNLKKLNLSNCTDLTKFPDEMSNLISLKEIDFSGKALESIPKFMLSLKNLEVIDFSYCFLIPYDLKFDLDFDASQHSKPFPEEISQITSLKKLDFKGCDKIKNLPDSMDKLINLSELNMEYCEGLESLPERLGDLASLQKLNFAKCKNLKNLPETIGDLKNLEELDCSECGSLQELPKNIGNLENLRILNLTSVKNVSKLPKSIKNLKNLEVLHLSGCSFTEIPSFISNLPNLKEFLIKNNPLKGQDAELAEDVSISKIQDYIRKKSGYNVFISHAVVDFDNFRVEEVSKKLEQQEDIYQAYFCEQDLRGNIDEFMNQMVPQSEIVVFLATRNSIYNSKDCAHELELAQNFAIPVIPIKGYDVTWEDITRINLNKEYGLEYDQENFSKFVEDLYSQISFVKEQIGEGDEKGESLKKIKESFEKNFEECINSKYYKWMLQKNCSIIENAIEQYNEEKIDLGTFIINYTKNLLNNLKDFSSGLQGNYGMYKDLKGEFNLK